MKKIFLLIVITFISLSNITAQNLYDIRFSQNSNTDGSLPKVVE